MQIVPAPVCIAGMARSGTSMVTRLLNLCGLWLGDERDMLSPAPDNPDGFWENTRLIAVNEMILSAFGGAWDCPPAFPAGWVDDPRLNDARILAAGVLGSFAGHAPWGWKDPRNSLTFPFWEHALPETKVIVCVRNPLEVARSLHQWMFSPELSLTLWYQFNAALLRAVPPERRIVTHYDSFFAAPEASLRRVLDFVGLPASDATVTDALAAIALRLRHHRLTTAHLHEAGVNPALLDLYAALCEEAEASETVGAATHGALRPHPARLPHPPRVVASNDVPANVGGLNRAVVDTMNLRAEVRDLKAEATAAHEANAHLRAWAAELERRIAAARADHAAQDAYAARLEAQIAALQSDHAAQDAYAARLEARIAALQSEHVAQNAYARRLEQQLTTVQTDHHTMSDRLVTAHTEHATLDAYARDLEARIAALQDAHATLEGYVARLEGRIAAADADHAALAAYAGRLEDALAAVDDLRGRLQTVEAHYGELHAAHCELADYTERLETQLAIARHDHDVLRDRAETVLARLRDAEQECAQQANTIATLRASRAAQEQRVRTAVPAGAANP